VGLIYCAEGQTQEAEMLTNSMIRIASCLLFVFPCFPFLLCCWYFISSMFVRSLLLWFFVCLSPPPPPPHPLAQASPAFQQFLEFIGDKVRLKGYTKFNGGLDVETDNTGTHAIATEYEAIQLMFHVSTMLPHNHSEYEQLVKRQFIGM
jgi:hypothetical protein